MIYGLPIRCAVARRDYDFTLTAPNDWASELIGSGWGLQALLADVDSSGTRTVGDYIFGLSFPNVAVPSCSSATLTLQVTELLAGTWKLSGQSNAVSASAPWAYGPNRPSNASFVATVLTGLSTATGGLVLDVTTTVQEIMAGLMWAQGRLNFVGEATSAGAGLNVTAAPRLQITP